MRIALNKAHFPVTVLGPGRRLGLWLQGCSIHCPNCVSQDTWPFDRGRETTVAAILTWARKVSGDQLDGVTISGGEPFDQPKALGALLAALSHWRESIGGDFDVLAYSGYALSRLQEKHPRLLAQLDALIPEPYVDTLPRTHLWRGSANQPLIPLSPRGKARYAPYLEQKASADSRMQSWFDGERLWVVGIPDRGDMATLEAEAGARGLTLKDVSWR
ncbi:MAG: radical SAM protein [Betaproteobacteria bacterium]|nr:radical SAM protein [Betaproteobacteria bacterium]